ncbi:MAG: hypothetical protein AAF547_20145, partial [Actinomycetota bacterium]
MKTNARGAGRRIVFEAHRLPEGAPALYRRLFRGVAGIVAITVGLAELLIERGVPRERVLVAPDGVRLTDFENLPSQA